MMGISKTQQCGRLKKKKKKATNNPKNHYFKFMRDNYPECIICGDFGEIHHIDLGYKRNDKRIIMLCNRHHSAQSMDGIHHDMIKWHEKHYTFIEIEVMAEENLNLFENRKILW